MEERTRAFRRHQEFLKKESCKKLLKKIWNLPKKVLKTYSKNRKQYFTEFQISPRKNKVLSGQRKLTLPERKALADLNEAKYFGIS